WVKIENAMAIECLADDELLSQAHPEKADVSNSVKSLAQKRRKVIETTLIKTGPRVSEVSEEEWGVNHRALNDLFQLCEDRRLFGTCNFTKARESCTISTRAGAGNAYSN
ncbi:hypothetical protein Tco_1245843, partial [Tanacetum coccineum]